MISLGPFILIAGISIVILLCWVWLPFAVIAKLCGLGAHRKKNTGLLPVRAAAGEVRYRAEGFVLPPQVLQNDPHAFDPEVRHHNYLKVDPRRAEQRFQNREARGAYEDTFGLDRRRSGGHRIRSREGRGERSAGAAGAAGKAGQNIERDVQKPAATLIRNQEHWEKLRGHLEAQR
ncbi:hypothetical protein FJTKL_13206 [Diaporthe vaccinii]|uniref:Uncharacterized protein n=1 Tax=Diaporthe vaccinii TaxID=105482 RepID=A0ABR4EBQ6_9PEZI